MKAPLPENRFYVYVLFDENGIPRYVGKGTRNRWNHHEQRPNDDKNFMKKSFIKKTLDAIGEIPKIKVRTGLTGDEALETEIALIKAIGRTPSGPLTNMTDGGDVGYQLTHAQLSDAGRKGGRSVSKEVRSASMKKWWASLTEDQRKAERIIRFGPADKDKISLAVKRGWDSMSEQERKESGRCRHLGRSKEGYSQAAKIGWSKFSAEERTARRISALASTTNEQRSDATIKGWETRRKNLAKTEQPTAAPTGGS